VKLSTKITAGLLAGATLVASASPAEAQWRGHYRHHRGDRTALALGAGALGLAVGAAIGSSSRHRGYYGDSYYGGGYYRPYAYNGYYDGGYYGQPYGYGYGYRSYYAPRRCWTDRQWDDWRGRWRRVRVCDRY